MIEAAHMVVPLRLNSRPSDVYHDFRLHCSFLLISANQAFF
jgi:hypothetical protein